MSFIPPVVHEWTQTALANLPPPVQQALLHPLVPKALAAILAFTALRQTNRAFNSLSLSNFSTRKWDNARELVLLTGGCSGIGKQIMTELSSHGAKVIILDINEPSFKLRTSPSLCKTSQLLTQNSTQRPLLQSRHHLLRRAAPSRRTNPARTWPPHSPGEQRGRCQRRDNPRRNRGENQINVRS